MKTIYDPRYRSMIKWLIEARKKQGVSQVQVTVKLGVPRTRITKIESFDRRLDGIKIIPEFRSKYRYNLGRFWDVKSCPFAF